MSILIKGIDMPTSEAIHIAILPNGMVFDDMGFDLAPMAKAEEVNDDECSD